MRKRLEVPGPAESGQGRSGGHPRAPPCGREQASAGAMFAALGCITLARFRFPGYLSPSIDPKFEDMPKGLAALSALRVQGCALIVAFIGVVETTGFFSGEAKKLGPQRGATHAGKFRNFRVGFFTFIGTVEGPKVRQKQAEARAPGHQGDHR